MLRKFLLCGLLVYISTSLFASEQDIEVHGYLSRGYMKSDKYNFLAENSKNGTTKWGELGLNFAYQAHEKLRFGAQILARELGTVGEYNPELDWGFADYRIKNGLSLKYGKFFTPWGLHGDGRDVDILRNTILLPQNIYSDDYRDISLMKGLELHGNFDIGKRNLIEYRIAKGNIDFSSKSSFLLDVQASLGNPTGMDMNIDGLLSYGIVWNTWVDGLRLGLTSTEYDVAINANATPYILLDNSKNFQVISLEYTKDEWTYTYERLTHHFDRVVGPIRTTMFDNHSYYHQLIYRLNDRFEFGVVSSDSYSNTLKGKTKIDEYQKDLAFTVRVDMTENWVLKLEYHDMSGIDSLRTTINPGVTAAANQGEDWDMIMAKVTYSF